MEWPYSLIFVVFKLNLLIYLFSLSIVYCTIYYGEQYENRLNFNNISFTSYIFPMLHVSKNNVTHCIIMDLVIIHSCNVGEFVNMFFKQG